MTPTPRLLWLCVALAGVALGAAFWPWMALTWKLCAALLVAAAGLDAVLGWARPPLQLRREVRGGLPIGAWSPVTLRLENPRATGLALRLHDHYPEDRKSVV